MQKLKRRPLLQRLGDTLENLRQRALLPLWRLGISPRLVMTAALIGLFLMGCLALSGCAPRTVRPTLPPQADPRPVPQFQGKTYRDVILYVIELKESCQASEADKAAIRRVYAND